MPSFWCVCVILNLFQDPRNISLKIILTIIHNMTKIPDILEY
jgi:hypothetical protein